MRRFVCIILTFSLFPLWSFGQKGVTTVGIQYKPIFPLSFVGTGKQVQEHASVTSELELKSGFCGGMIIRHGFSDLVAMEAGINYVKRKYRLTFRDSGFSGSSQFRIVGYEIPFSFLAYIQLGEKLFMNASMGPSFDFFASDVETYDDYFVQVSRRNQLLSVSILANIGWEWRTEKSGYLYLGASYHRPFSYTYDNTAKYNFNNKEEYFYSRLLGNYLTVDIRYFFHQDARKTYRK
ncbi:MAG: hypothetical protein IT242_03035 [Bacteroidia bacterium]|nr:hypothetical protein [Bacteroidia bacterium]